MIKLDTRESVDGGNWDPKLKLFYKIKLCKERGWSCRDVAAISRKFQTHTAKRPM